jgi:hypothetical protein
VFMLIFFSLDYEWFMATGFLVRRLDLNMKNHFCSSKIPSITRDEDPSMALGISTDLHFLNSIGQPATSPDSPHSIKRFGG